MKKETVGSKCYVICAIVLLVIISVICLAYANKMQPNMASIMGGVLSVAATTLLGVIAVWQNKKYKELADAKSKQAEELMFTPECRLLTIQTNSYNPQQMQLAIVETENTEVYCLGFSTLNLTMIDITIEEITYYEKGDLKHKKVFPHNKFLFSISKYKMIGENCIFEIGVNIPSEFLGVDTICCITLTYKNIYDSVVHKTVEFERAANGNTKITKQERAILIGK